MAIRSACTQIRPDVGANQVVVDVDRVRVTVLVLHCEVGPVVGVGPARKVFTRHRQGLAWGEVLTEVLQAAVVVRTLRVCVVLFLRLESMPRN